MKNRNRTIQTDRWAALKVSKNQRCSSCKWIWSTPQSSKSCSSKVIRRSHTAWHSAASTASFRTTIVCLRSPPPSTPTTNITIVQRVNQGNSWKTSSRNCSRRKVRLYSCSRLVASYQNWDATTQLISSSRGQSQFLSVVKLARIRL